MFECNSYAAPKVFYLRSDGYFAFYTTTEESEGPVIWLKKTADSDCPTDNLEAFGFWNFDLSSDEKHDIAERSEIDWTNIDATTVTTEELTTTTTVQTTESTTTTKVRFERVKPTNMFRVLWHKFYQLFIFP